MKQLGQDKRNERYNDVNKSDVIKLARDHVRETDPYWQEPLFLRMYQRVICALFWFLTVSCLFDAIGAPLAFQAVMGSVAAIGALMFRMAYPGGVSDVLGITNVFSEALAEANKQLSKQQEESNRKATSPGGLRNIAGHNGKNDAGRNEK